MSTIALGAFVLVNLLDRHVVERQPPFSADFVAMKPIRQFKHSKMLQNSDPVGCEVARNLIDATSWFLANEVQDLASMRFAKA